MSEMEFCGRLSGADCPALPGARVIPDEYTGKGPLGGLHACLKAARNPVCRKTRRRLGM